MRRISIDLFRAVSLLILVLFALACTSEVVFEDTAPVTVGLVAGGGDTRTEMHPNGLSAYWSAGDEIAVWAKQSTGSYSLSNQKFTTFGLDGNFGFFTSTIEKPMEDDIYTYYCCYPVPDAVNSTKVTFTIPEVQNGKVTDGADIMIATPVQHGPLTAVLESDDHSRPSLQMNRMLHQFRFYIPQDIKAVLGNQRVNKIELTFPEAVCGAVEFDLSNPNALGKLVSGKNRIIINLPESMDISSEDNGTYDFACVSMFPRSFAPGQKMTIRAFTDNKIAKFDPVDLKAKNFQEGHSTPVKLLVKELIDFPYQITFKLAGNNVGENVTAVHLTAPSGCIWPDSGTNKYTYAPAKGNMLVGETVTIKFPDYEEYAKFSGTNIDLVLETENTMYETSANIGTIPVGVEKHASNISASVPYLLYQDFSAIQTYSDGHDSPKVGTGSDTYTGITELSSCGLTGWYGTRIGIQGGTSARICCRYQHVLLAGAYYKGRLYTPQLSRIKEGKDVKIEVSYKYGSNREERKPTFGSKPDKSPILYFGINTQDSVTNPDQSEGDIIDSVTGMIAGSGFSNSTPTSLSPVILKGETLDKENGSYTNLPKSKTLTIENVDRDVRLGWILTTDNSSSNTNANYWFYIDEIKVQITK